MALQAGETVAVGVTMLLSTCHPTCLALALTITSEAYERNFNQWLRIDLLYGTFGAVVKLSVGVAQMRVQSESEMAGRHKIQGAIISLVQRFCSWSHTKRWPVAAFIFFLLCAPTFPFALAADKNCAIPTEDEFIEAAVTYFLKVRQPSG
ncbi:hypothetical protein, partial [Tabrizicola oligotrophica]